jgi:hypothetical protein
LGLVGGLSEGIGRNRRITLCVCVLLLRLFAGAGEEVFDRVGGAFGRELQGP